MKKYVIIFLIFSSLAATAQQWQWYHQIGGPEQDFAKSAMDSEGNLYVFANYGNQDCYLQKFSPGGDTLWIIKINYGNNSTAGVSDIIVDKHNFIYIAGSFVSKAVFGNDTLISTNFDVFLAKYSSDGTCIWARQSGGDGSEITDALAIDENSNIFITGANTGPAIFGSFSVPAGGFLAKYDSMGTCILVKKITNLIASNTMESFPVTSMKVVNNQLFITATEWSDTFSVDTITINHPNQHGHALCCFDLEGNIHWVKEGLSGIAYSAYKMGSDINNNIYVTGYFYKTINFSGVILNVQTSTSGSISYGIFTAKYDNSGNLIFAKDIPIVYYPGSEGGRSNSIVTDNTGNYYLTGCFNGSAVFGPDTVVSETYQDFFLARFNPDGDCLGAFTFGAAEGISVDTDPAGNPVVVGVTGLPSAMDEMNIFLAKGSPITGITKKSAPSKQLLIYANPNDGTCNIELPAEFINAKNLELNIFNNAGEVIQNAIINNEEENISIDIRAEAKGIYNVVLSNGKKNYSGKIIFK